MAHFDNDQYTKLISSLPLISIDFIVKNTNEEILLGLRKNNPASGFWFVPGGRIRRMESITEACSRISRSELGVSIEIGETKLIGIFEHMYHNSSYSEDIGVHYISLGFETNALDLEIDKLPKSQHINYKWFNISDIKNSEEVHVRTKDFFNEKIGIRK